MKLAFGGGATSPGWRGSWMPGHLRRRLLAAVLAAAAVLIGLSSLHRPAQTTRSRSSTDSPSGALLRGLHPGEVAAPIRLVDPGVAPLLHSGIRVDVLAAPISPDGSTDAAASLARVVARGVRVLAVSRADAQALAGAEAGGRLSVTLESG
jgi:hypothetical protein